MKSNSDDVDVNVREELAKLGNSLPHPIYVLIQTFLTWMTGKPHRGQAPIFKATPLYHLATALGSLFGGVIASVFIVNSLPTYCYPLLFVSWLYTVGGARKLQTTICHYCVHKKVFENYLDRWLAEVLSTILLTQDFKGYWLDHIKLHHHVSKFSTMSDPDLEFLHILGFGIGKKN